MRYELVIASAKQFVEAHLGDRLDSAFLYGSFARGTAKFGSDLDLFCIVNKEVFLQEREIICARAISLQIDLEFQPDSRFPIEIFSVTEIEKAVFDFEPQLPASILARLALEPDSDWSEIIRALSGSNIRLKASKTLESFCARARRKNFEMVSALQQADTDRFLNSLGIEKKQVFAREQVTSAEEPQFQGAKDPSLGLSRRRR